MAKIVHRAMLWAVVVFMMLLVRGASAQNGAQKIEIHAKRFSFEPAEITIKEGEPVTLHLTSDDVPHSLVIDDLGVKGSMTKGRFVDVSFTPTKAGTFQGKCGRFCGSGHGSMKFIVHVTDK